MTDDLISRAAAKVACQKVADEAKGYGIPQMAMSAHTCRDAILALPAADLSSPLGAVVKPLVWVVHMNGWLSAETIGGEFWVQKGLSTSECQKRHNARVLAALEPPTHAALLAAALALPEVAALVEALKWYDDPSSQGDVACTALAALEAKP